MQRNSFLTLLTSSTLIALSSSALAADPVGTVVSTAGSVKASSQGQERALSRRSAIFTGDEINTAAASKVQIIFNDGTYLTLQENSKFAIHNYQAANNSKSGEFKTELVKGGLSTLTGTIAKQNPGQYEVKTPVATIGVRGTMYKASIDSHNSLNVTVNHGNVAVAASDGGTNTVGDNSTESNLSLKSASSQPIFSNTPAASNLGLNTNQLTASLIANRASSDSSTPASAANMSNTLNNSSVNPPNTAQLLLQSIAAEDPNNGTSLGDTNSMLELVADPAAGMEAGGGYGGGYSGGGGSSGGGEELAEATDFDISDTDIIDDEADDTDDPE